MLAAGVSSGASGGGEATMAARIGSATLLKSVKAWPEISCEMAAAWR